MILENLESRWWGGLEPPRFLVWVSTGIGRFDMVGPNPMKHKNLLEGVSNLKKVPERHWVCQHETAMK